MASAQTKMPLCHCHISFDDLILRDRGTSFCGVNNGEVGEVVWIHMCILVTTQPEAVNCMRASSVILLFESNQFVGSVSLDWLWFSLKRLFTNFPSRSSYPPKAGRCLASCTILDFSCITSSFNYYSLNLSYMRKWIRCWLLVVQRQYCPWMIVRATCFGCTSRRRNH